MRRRLVMAAAAVTVVAGAAVTVVTLRSDDVEVGQVVDPSRTAAVEGRLVSVMLPSGRADFTVGEPRRDVPAEAAADGEEHEADSDADVVGLSWTLNTDASPGTGGLRLSPRDVSGEPRAVSLELVADGTRHRITGVGTLLEPGRRRANAVWIGVPSGTRSISLEVGYAGVTQRVDVRTGKVTPGRAAALYRPAPVSRYAECETGELETCSLDYAVGYAYVTGAGWAPRGMTFALLDVEVGTSNRPDLTVDGRRAVTRIERRDAQVFAVGPAATHTVGSATSVREFRATIDGRDEA